MQSVQIVNLHEENLKGSFILVFRKLLFPDFFSMSWEY